MSWNLFLILRSNRGWVPVSNTDDNPEVDMDELMRMADGYDESGAEVLDGGANREEAVFHRHQTAQNLPTTSALLSSSSVPTSAAHHPFNQSDSACKSFCLGSFPSLVFPSKRWYHVLVSVLVIFIFIGLNVGLGVYSLIYYYPDKLVIDKSVKSFSIPDHQVYRNFEAMMLARKDNSSAGRYRRDTNTFSNARLRQESSITKEDAMLQETNSVLQNLRTKHSSRDYSRNKNPVLQMTSSQDFSMGLSINSALNRARRSTQEIGCLLEYQSIARWKMHVIYLAHGDNDTNMFTKERLQTVHAIEKKIVNHPGFHNFCLRDPHMEKYDPSVKDMQGCVPLNSLMTYFYPSKDNEGQIYYDGMGANIVDINSALQLAMNEVSFYYYVDEKINTTYQKSHLLRSEVLFGAPLPGYRCVNDYRKDQDEKFKEFVVTYINLLSSASTDKVRVLYGGNEIFDYEVSTSFWSDVRLAIISLVAILVLMLVLSLSLYMTIAGVVIIGVSFPISLFFYRVVFGINALGILNGAAAFVIIGIGVDDIFVYMNIYRQADFIKEPMKRIWDTIKTAGVATFFTSFTTAAAFAANIASSIPAVYEFGLFMSLIVSSCWISVFILMPPMLFLHACYIEPVEKFLLSCFSCVSSQGESSNRPSAADSHQQQVDTVQPMYVDDDLPLVDVQDGGDSRVAEDGMDDDNMLLMDDPYADVCSQSAGEATGSSTGAEPVTNSSDSLNKEDNMCLGLLLQKLMMLLTDKVVIRWRYIVLGFYVTVLITSCCLLSRLRPATHPPQLFRPDTNIQQLLDLKANFTIIDALHCDRCSAIYKVHASVVDISSPLQQSTPQPKEIDKVSKYQSTRAVDSLTSASIYTSRTISPDRQSGRDLHPNQGDTSSQDKPSSGSGQNESTPLKSMASDVYKLLHDWLSLADKSSPSIPPYKSAVTRPFPVTHLPVTPVPHQRVESSQSGPTTQNNHNLEVQTPDQTSSSKGIKSSVEENFNPCKNQSCSHLKDRPLLESGATVYVVFGIKGVDRSQEDVGHVLDQFKGRAIFEPKFANAFNLNHFDPQYLRELCKVCTYIANRTDLVREGSAQCLPSGMQSLRMILNSIPECKELPGTLSIYQHQAPAHAEGGLKGTKLLWLAFAFESTTSEGQAYFEAYKQFEKWEKMISDIKHNLLAPDSPLECMFQTSEFWTKVMMEVVAVNSAIYGLVLSMIICVVSVAVFTGHLVLLLIVVVTIIAMVCCVVGVFYLASWEMGAVEAVSLSILVGSSVDYCVHIVEGYILAGKRMSLSYMKGQSASDLRRERTSQAVRHIGVAIVCSALTTIIAAVPLTQTFIQPFAKFGSILLINTTVSMVMTLTLAVALLATVGPARYRGGWKAHLIAFVVVASVVGVIILGLYIASTQGVSIPGPSGNPLFS